ncbi:BamA/TamA family outer membrane protein, partial [Acinetobacter baumannii]
TLRQDRIYDVDPGAAFIIQQSVGNAVTSSVNQALTYDKRDDKLEPTKGYILKFGNDVAGLGGNQSYLRFLLEGTYYYPISDNWVLSAGST